MSRVLRLFEGYGLEMEYMIVDRETLDVRPLADEVLKAEGGGYELAVERGDMAWSNELALHVIEIKTNGPVADLRGVASRFQAEVARIEEVLAPLGARLLPGGMHPWMDPEREFRIWPHEDEIIYATFHRIFDCTGHGWANLQSTHINLPFADDEEFGRLHAAIRLVLPVLPAIAASSPFREGHATGMVDTRLEVYRGNARRVPSVSGHVVPERVFTRGDYEGILLQGIYDDLAGLDPDGVLAHEWVNARGTIARFDRMALEIRLLDIQECPRADVAVAAAVTALVRKLTEERTVDTATQRGFAEEPLAALLREGIRDGETAVIRDADYLRALGHPAASATAGEVWDHLVATELAGTPGWDEWREPLELISTQGPLARRMLAAAGDGADRGRLRATAARLADCLAGGTLFRP